MPHEPNPLLGRDDDIAFERQARGAASELLRSADPGLQAPMAGDAERAYATFGEQREIGTRFADRDLAGFGQVYLWGCWPAGPTSVWKARAAACRSGRGQPAAATR